MSRTMQSMTLGLALAAAGFAGAAFVQNADADRAVAPFEHGIAFVDVFGLIDEILKGPELEAVRVAFDEGKQAELTRMQSRMQEIQGQVEAMDENDPTAAGLFAEAQQLQQNMQQFYQNYQFEMQGMIAEQIGSAYKQVFAAAKAQAAEEGVDFLFATRPSDDLIVDSLTGVAQEILARPMIAPSDAIDLTPGVRARLGLPDPSDAPADAGTDAATPDTGIPGSGEPATEPASEGAGEGAGEGE